MENLTPRREDLEPIEYASRDEISALQLKRMKQSIRHACENSPFFCKLFDETGIHPNDLNSLSDLSKFPFTHKQDLCDTYPFGMFAVPQNKLARIHGSSGTTGKPTVVGYTKGDIDTWADLDCPLDTRRRAAVRAISCTMPMATACSPAAWARTTAPSGSAAPSFRFPAA